MKKNQRLLAKKFRKKAVGYSVIMGLLMNGALSFPTLSVEAATGGQAPTLAQTATTILTNPNLTPFNAQLGVDQKNFQSSTKDLTDAYSQFISSQNNLNDSTEQQKVLSTMDAQLSNLDTFISDLQAYVATNPSSDTYPNLISNLNQYISELQTYQNLLKTTEADLKAAIDQFTKANSEAQTAYESVATAYQDLISNNYSSVGTNYQSLMQTGKYLKLGNQYSGSNVTGYDPYVLTTSPTKTFGGAKNPESKASAWDNSVIDYQSKVANWRNTLQQYQTVLSNYQNSYPQSTTIDSSLTSLYDQALTKYNSNQTIYENAQKNYESTFNLVKTHADNNDYLAINTAVGYDFPMRIQLLYTSAYTMMNSDLTSPTNSFGRIDKTVSPKTLTQLQSSSVWGTPLMPTSNVYSAMNNNGTFGFINGGYFATNGSGDQAAFLEEYGIYDNTNGTYLSNVTNVLGPLATQMANGAINAVNYYASIGGVSPTNYLGSDRMLKQGNLTLDGQANIGFGLPFYHQFLSKIEDASGNVINAQPIADPVPSEMDYPSAATILKNANHLLEIGNWNSSLSNNATGQSVMMTQTMLDNYREALELLKTNFDSTFSAAVGKWTSAFEAYGKNPNPTTVAALQAAYIQGAKDVEAAYQTIYGKGNLSDLQNVNNVFSNDLSTLSSTDLAAKYGYRSLLAGMSSLVDIGYYNNIQWPTLEPGQIISKAFNLIIGQGVNTLSASIGTINTAPYLTAPPSIDQPTVPPTMPVITDLKFSEILPTPPNLYLDYEPPLPVLPYTGGEGSPLLIGSILGISSLIGGAGILRILYKKKDFKK